MLDSIREKCGFVDRKKLPHKDSSMINKQDSKIGDNKQIIYIIITSIVVRAIWLSVLICTGKFPFQVDTVGYIENAKSFVDCVHFVYDGYRTPGYPLIISGFMCLSYTHYYICVFIFQNIANIISICAVYQIILVLTDNKKAGIVGSGIAALNFLDIYYCNSILTDSIAQSLTCVSLLFMIMFLNGILKTKTSLGYILIGSLLLAYAVLIRPSLVFLPFAFVMGFVFVEILKKKYKLIVPTILIVSILCYTPVYFWTVRNGNVADYIGYSTVSPKNYYCFNSAAVYSLQNNMSYNDTVEYLKEGKDEKYQEYIKTMNKYDAMNLRAKEIIASDIPTYLKRCAIDIAFLEFYPGVLSFHNVRDGLDKDIENIKQKGFSAVIESDFIKHISKLMLLAVDCLILFILFLFSIIGAFKILKKDWITAILLIGTALYHVVVCCQPVGFGAYSRFRLSFSMVTIILATCALFIHKNNSTEAKATVKTR